MFGRTSQGPAPSQVGVLAVLAGLLLAVAFLNGCSQSQPRVATTRPAEVSQLRQDLREMIAAARDRVFPSLVNISVVTVDYWGGKEHKGRVVGSGIIISPEGHVLTNQHVTNHGKKFKCTLADKQELSAELVGEDPLTDLAVLKLDLSELSGPNQPLPVAEFGDSDELQIGDYVMAMGSPWALSRSVTLGIVSNTERVFADSSDNEEPEVMELEEGQRTGLFTRWIQHDASINPGNSGGPLVNLKGEVVGINELGTFFGGDMGFAIPANMARTVAAALIEHGKISRSWIGLSFKPIKKTGLKDGVLVNSVVEDGPAEKAGIRAGDVILSIDGEAITVRFPEQVPPLLKWIADRPIGSSLKVTYKRRDAVRETTIVTEPLKKDRGQETAFRAWGLTALEITEKMARERRLESTQGVLVSGVRDGGPAQLAEPPIAQGDVIRSINGQVIRDLSAFIDLNEKIMKTKPLPQYVLIEFDRRGRNHLTLLKPKPDKDEDPPREVPKAWIGIATQPVLKKLARQLGHPNVRGFRVTRVYPRTLAARSGLRVGDVITALNGENLRPRGMQDAGLLARKVRKLEIGQVATLRLFRNGQMLQIPIQLERTRIMPDEARRDRNRDFELTVREVTFFDRDERCWDDDVKGVLVTDVERAGWAGLGGLRPGDLIQKIDDYQIKGLKSYREAMQAITEAQPERVVFVVLRGVQTRFQYVEPDWKPVAKPQSDSNQKE